MNIKALNKNELHDLFQKYKDVPNINEIKIMGKVTEFSQRGDSTKGNPVYSIISPKTELSVAPFETVKLSLDIPSPARIDAEGNPYLILRSDEASDSNVVYQSSTIGFWGMSMSVGTETLSVKGRTRGVQLVFASEEEIDDFISVIVQAKLHREDIETIKDLFK